jgi:hypothetical protein
MAFTVYGLLTSNATATGPYYTSRDVTAITGGVTPLLALISTAS